jgi:hypothetical protein
MINKKSERMRLSRWNLERAFEPGKHQRFEVCARLLFIWMTSSDSLSRRNVLYSESYLDKFKDNPEFQKDALFESRVIQLQDVLRKAKDRLTNRELRREKKEAALQDKEAIAAKKLARKNKNAPPPVPAPEVDPSILWKKWIEEREKKHE